MKKLFIACLLFSALRVQAQSPLSYEQLLNECEEIRLTDSVPASSLTMDMRTIDTATLLRYFSPVLSGAGAIKLKNREFYIGGKITTRENFNLHVLIEDKKKDDSMVLRVIYLVTTKKDGVYISSFKAAVSGTKKKSSYNTSSYISKDLAILQDSRITTNTGSMTDVAKYKITNNGRFMMQLN